MTFIFSNTITGPGPPQQQLEACEISPTLCEFFNVPFHTRMSEEDVTLKIWSYIQNNRLLIDNRKILLNSALLPVIHPPCIKQEKCDTENSLVMIYVAKMHMDPTFIEQDLHYRLDRIRKNILARKIFYFYRLNKNKRVQKSDTPTRSWCSYIATHFGNFKSISDEEKYDKDDYE